jgi:hypothetical protein
MPTLNEEQLMGLNAASEREASGLANKTDLDNIDYAKNNLGYKYTPPNSNAGLADAVENVGQTNFQAGIGIEGYDQALANQGATPTTTTATDTSWMNDWMKSAFGQGDQQVTDQVQAPTFDVEKARLTEARNSRIQALDAQYATNLATLQKKNKDLGSSLKARLMKLGVSPSDSAWSNAEAGQAQRDAEAESALRSEYLSNKAKIEADVDAQISAIAMNEANMQFNATVKNIENKLATQAQGINLYQIFSQRDQSERDREQRAYAALQDYEAKMITLDQAQQEALAKNLIENAQKGFYNISDPNTLEMLASLEKQSPYLIGLTNIASAGLSDRLESKAQAAADLAKTNVDIERIKASTAQAYASIQKMRSESSSAGDKLKKAFYDDAESQLKKLASGETDWGTAYNTMMQKYKQEEGSEDERIQSELVDRLLNKDVFSQTGAYEEIQARRKNNTLTPFDEWIMAQNQKSSSNQ